MNPRILEPHVQKYIADNWNQDTTPLLFQQPKFEGVTQSELVLQLELKKKCRLKLPTWFSTPNIYYPKKINIEQTSSESAAKYKAGLLSGKSLVDLTGGFGVDSYHFAKRFDQVIHCELNSALSEVVQHNFKVLEIPNVQCHAVDGILFLDTWQQPLDCIYLDPARRDAEKKRVYRLEDCQPDILKHLDLFLDKSETVLLKTAPLLDITKGLQQLQSVKAIHVVAIQNEVKEVLWILQKEVKEAPTIHAVHLMDKHQETFSFTLAEEKGALADLSAPKRYLYVPNPSIMKAGAFKTVGAAYGVSKLHLHSHLYTSDQLIAFPGRRFEIQEVIPYKRKTLGKLDITHANIATRNFPKNVATLRKETGIKDGGDHYLFFTTDCNEQLQVLVCHKINSDKAT